MDLFAQYAPYVFLFHPNAFLNAWTGHDEGSGQTPPSPQLPRKRETGHVVIPSGLCYAPHPDGVEKSGLPHYALKPCAETYREAQAGKAQLHKPHHNGVSARKPTSGR